MPKAHDRPRRLDVSPVHRPDRASGGWRRSVAAEVQRVLGFWDLMFLGIGAAIGSGWLFGVQYAANMAGPAAIAAWLAGGVLVGFIALVYAELGAMLPDSGAVVRYPEFSHGSVVGFLTGIAAIVAYSTIPPIEAEAVVQYLALPALWNRAQDLPTALGWVVEAALISGFFLLNVHGVRLFARVNNLLTVVKIGFPILALIALVPRIQSANFTRFGGFSPYGLHGVLAALAGSGIVFSMLGFRQAIDLSGEARDPGHDVPRAILLGLVIVALLYAALEAVFVGTVPAPALAHGFGGLALTAPLVALLGLLGLGSVGLLVRFGALIAPVGSGLIYFASTGRTVVGFTRNGSLWQRFAVIDPRSGVPRAALWLAFGLGLVWTGPFPVWQALVGFASGAAVLTYMTGPVSVLVLRRTAPYLKRPVVIPSLPVVAFLAFGAGTAIVYWTGFANVWPLTALEALSLLAYLLFLHPRRPAARRRRDLRASIWFLGFLGFVLVLSYVGSFGGNDTVPYPLDLAILFVASIGFFVWAVLSGVPFSADPAPEDALTPKDHMGPTGDVPARASGPGRPEAPPPLP